MRKKTSQNGSTATEMIEKFIANETGFRDYFEKEKCSIGFLKACFRHGNEALREAALAHIEDSVQKTDIALQDIGFLDELILFFQDKFSLAASYNALTEVGEYDMAWKCVRRVLDEFYGGPDDGLLNDPEYLEAVKVSADCYLEGRGAEQNVRLALDIYNMLYEKGRISRIELNDFEIKAESVQYLEKIRKENGALFNANEALEGYFKRF